MYDDQPNVLINVFQFPLLTNDECENITKIVLMQNTVDVTNFLTDFITQYIPLITCKINDLYDFGKKINYSVHTAHAVIYDANGDGKKALSMHQDDSDITINITIHMKDLLGSELRFIGSTPYGNSICMTYFEKNRIKDPLAVNSISHQLGSYVIHRGDHLHEVSAIYNGEKITLVFYLKRIKS